MRWFRTFVVLAIFAVLGVGVIHADATTPTPAPVPTFSDGRVNDWQMDEPVAIYCVFDHTQDVNVGVFQSVDVWGLSGDKLLSVSAAKIASTSVPKKATSVVLDSNQGYALSKLADGSFQVTAPDGYNFTWQYGGIAGC